MSIAAFRNSNYRIFFAGNLFALNGLWMQRLIYVWMGWELTGSASFVGLLVLINTTPTIFLGPAFGVLADRYDVRRAALGVQSMTLTLGLLFLLLLDQDVVGPAVLGAFSFAAGGLFAVHNAVRMSLVPRLVPRDALKSVVTTSAINMNIAKITGPAICGWIIANYGLGAAVLIQSLFFIPIIISLSRVTVRSRITDGRPQDSFRHAFGVGMAKVIQTPLIRRALLLTAVFAFIIRGTIELLPALADSVFDAGADGAGVLLSSVGVGALLAGFAKLMPFPGHHPFPALISTLVGMATVFLLGSSGIWTLTIILATVLGFTVTYTAISLQTAIQDILDDEMRGRVMSVWITVSHGTNAIGAMILGLFVDGFGPALGLGVAGIIGMALIGFGVFKQIKSRI